jgi:hypothetical protein
MALDSGGSSTLAFDGTVLNSPSDGKERAVSTALMLQYYGVYAPPPLEAVVSPERRRVAETQKLSYKIVRPQPHGDAHRARRHDRVAGVGEREPGIVRRRVPPRAARLRRKGAASTADEPVPRPRVRWTFTVSATDDQGSLVDDDPAFAVNSTLAALRVAPAAVVVRKARRKAEIRWSQARAARVKVTIETPEGSSCAPCRTDAPAGQQTGALGRPRGNRKPVAVDATSRASRRRTSSVSSR